jgi:hypothetical protein
MSTIADRNRIHELLIEAQIEQKNISLDVSHFYESVQNLET